MHQSTFFDHHFDLSCVPPPESPMVGQRVVELEGLASSSFGVAILELPRGSAIEPLHPALVVPHLLSEETLEVQCANRACLANWGIGLQIHCAKHDGLGPVLGVRI